MSKGEWHERKVHDPDTRFTGLWEEFGGYGLDTALAASPLSLGVEHQFKKTGCPGGAESRTSESGVCVAWIVMGFREPRVWSSLSQSQGPLLGLQW